MPQAQPRHRGVHRTVRVLEYVAAQQTASLAQVAAHLQAPRSSTHDILQGLVDVGYLVETTHGFALGPGVAALLGQLPRITVPRAAYPHLSALVAELEETVVVGTRVGNNIVYLEQLESPHTMRYAATLRQRRPLIGTSMGKIFLADLPLTERRRMLAKLELTRQAMAKVVQELDQVRATGIAYNREETLPGVLACAAGLRNRHGELIAAVSCTGPKYRMEGRLPQMGERVLETAQAIAPLFG